MQLLRLPQLVEKVTLLRATENGCVPIVLFARDKKKRKKKRAGMGAGMVQQVAERMIDAQKAFADTLADRNDCSQREKPDGWLTDLPSNLFKASCAAGKKVRLYRVPG